MITLPRLSESAQSPLPTLSTSRSQEQSMDKNVVRVDPRSDPLWQRLVEKVPSSIFHSPIWIRVLTDTYGWEASAYVLTNQAGEPVAGIPFCSIVDIMGERTVVLPFSDYCDPLVPDVESWNLLIEHLLSRSKPVIVRCLHNAVPLADKRFALVKQAKWHGLDIQPELDTLWQGMQDSVHRAIRKSEREGITVRVGESEEDLRAFFEMHLKVRKYKYRLLAQPYVFFQNIWRHFMESQRGFLLLALCDGKIVAGDLFLSWKDTLYYKFNASHPEELSHRPNDLLIWKGLQLGKEKGLKYLDFGLSDIDQEGLVRYKRKFGTEEKEISFLRNECAAGTSGVVKEMQALLGKLTERFTNHQVPDLVTEQAGEDLYRLFT
jgi:CelD/BcsL family acetyltransferase involved in cellulose biosynthesis